MAGGGWYGRWPEVAGGSLTGSTQRGTAGSAGSLGTGGTGGASYSQGATAYYGSGRRRRRRRFRLCMYSNIKTK